MQKQKGFTLIELVVVIVILGVLAAVALPRFMDATEDAHTAAVKGTGGALAAGVALVRAQWELNKAKGALTSNNDVAGFGANNVDVNGSGWPLGTTDDTASCVEVWGAVLQGSAPSVTGASPDYVVTEGTTCIYTYSLDGRADGATPAPRKITYNTNDGVVAVSAD